MINRLIIFFSVLDLIFNIIEFIFLFKLIFQYVINN